MEIGRKYDVDVSGSTRSIQFFHFDGLSFFTAYRPNSFTFSQQKPLLNQMEEQRECARCKLLLGHSAFGKRTCRNKVICNAYCKPCDAAKQRERRASSSGQASIAKYKSTERYKEMRREYNKSAGAKASKKKFNASPKGLLSRQRTRTSAAGKLRKQKYAAAHRAYVREWRKTPAGRKKQKRDNERRRSKGTNRFADCLSSTLSRLLSKTSLSSKNSIRFTGFKDVDQFRTYIETTWQRGMSWDNYGRGDGKWVVDHICPKSMYDHSKAAEVFKCWNWRNLRACWWRQNLEKSADWNLALVETVPVEFWPQSKRP